MSELARVGTVSSIDATNYRARVYFTDLDDSVSELSIIDNGTNWLPEVDDEVLCIFIDGTEGTGFILGKQRM